MKLRKCTECGILFEGFNRTNKWGGWVKSRRCKPCLKRLAKTKDYEIKISQPISSNKKKLPSVPEELI